MRYRISGPDIVLEVFDQEVVLINLGTGKYFSTNPLGTQIWSALQNGASLAEIEAALSARVGALPASAGADLNGYLQQLLDHGLLCADPERSQGEPVELSVQAYQAPRVQVFEDLQELILLDPIHDVDETGWPQAAPAAGESEWPQATRA